MYLRFFIFLPVVLCSASAFGQETAAPDSVFWSIDLEDVVVTAQYAPTDSRNALQQIRTIDRQTIEQQGATNLEELLRQDLNIRIQQDRLLGSGLTLQGLSGQHVKIMIDGVPVVGRLDGNIDLSQINLQNIERVEIMEGPSSVVYGTDALAGVVNLITQKSQKGNWELGLTQQVGTRSESVSNLDAGLRFADQWLLRLGAGRDVFKGSDPDSSRSSIWNPKEQWYGNALIRKDFKNEQSLRYQLEGFEEKVDNLGEIRRPAFMPYANDDFFQTKRFNHSLAQEGKIGDRFYLQTTVAYNRYEREVVTYVRFLDTDSLTQTGGDTTAFHTWMARTVLASQLPDDKLNFSCGLDFQQETGIGARLLDTAFFEPGRSRLLDLAAFGSLRWQPITALQLEGALRWAWNSRYDAPMIPSVHLRYQPAEPLLLRLSYSQGFRSPSLKELFLSFIDINHFILGNPDLLAETSDNVQGSLCYEQESKLQRWSATLSGFYNTIRNQIQLSPYAEGSDGQWIPTAVSGTYSYFNLAVSRVWGSNLRLAYQWKTLQLKAGLARVAYYNPLSESVNTVAAFTPTLEFNISVQYQVPSLKLNGGLFYRQTDRQVSYTPVEENGTTFARQVVQDGYALLDGTLSRTFWKERVRLKAGVYNLLNVQQVNLAGNGGGAHQGSSIALVNPGRSYFATLQVRLAGK